MEKIPIQPIIHDEDTELIKAIISGDQSLFGDLVKKYDKRLFRFGLRMCREARDAEELVQDTFLNVFRYLNRFKFESRFKNWLYKIAGSVCLKKKRKGPASQRQEMSLEEFIPKEHDLTADQAPSWVSEPPERILNEELSERIRETVADLPEKYRLVLVLRDLEGFSTEETARILDLKPVTVKVRLHRARLFLKEKLKDYFGDDRT